MNVYLVKKPVKRDILFKMGGWRGHKESTIYKGEKESKGKLTKNYSVPRVHNTWCCHHAGPEEMGRRVFGPQEAVAHREGILRWVIPLVKHHSLEAGREEVEEEINVLPLFCSFQSSASASHLTKPNRWPEAREPSVTVQRGQIPGSRKG